MAKNEKLPELLCPAGNFECLVAAVSAGADAVYVGGKRFGARAFAKNFDIEELARAAVYCRLHGVKLYVTVNTLVDDKEFPELISYAAELYRIGVSALIIADLGAISEIRRCVPKLELHASTQMSVHNTAGAVAAKNLGVSRVVVARELPLSEIKSIVSQSGCEIEVFLHGALCVSYSGQCLFSSLVGGRSGNRGECAQPCRLPYNGKYPISLKDLSLADHIPALIESGVASLKIEGRMKSADYVYTVTKIYRALLDEGRAANAEEKEALRRAFSRGGFTDAYFKGKPQLPMTGIRSEGDKEDSRATEARSYEPQRVKVRAKVDIHLGEPSKMTLFNSERCVTAEGAVPVTAENAPLLDEPTRARLSKMGNTYLSLTPEDIELSLDEGVNLAPSALNALRRLAAEKFESVSRELPEFEYSPRRYPRADARPVTTAKFFSESAYLAAKNAAGGTSEYIDIPFIPLFSSEESLSHDVGVYLPPIIFDSETEEVKAALKKAKSRGVMYALVGNLGQIELAKSFGITPFGDFRLNVTNSHSAAVYRELGIEHTVLSPELTLPKARDIGGSVITYGRVPLMITERCFMKESFGCKNCGNATLTDRRGEKFPMIREFQHRNIILNSVPTYLGDRAAELTANRISSRHLLFTVESGEEILRVLKAHNRGEPLSGGKVRRAGRR